MQRLRTALTPWRAVLLAALLLAAQATGLVHRVAHGPAVGAADQPAVGTAHHPAHGLGHGHVLGLAPGSAPAPAPGSAPGSAPGPLDRAGLVAPGPWGHAAAAAHPQAGEVGHPASEAAAECRLYDQLLGHADALIGADTPAAGPVSAETSPVPQRPCRSRSAFAAYQARAPPPA